MKKNIARDFWIQAQGVIPQILWQAYNHSQNSYALTAKSLIQKGLLHFSIKAQYQKYWLYKVCYMFFGAISTKINFLKLMIGANMLKCLSLANFFQPNVMYELQGK